MQKSPSRYWFPAKQFGWGWGPPSSWHGWVVIAAFAMLFTACGYEFPPRSHPLAFAASVLALSIGLLVVCFAKGEPPRWKWGK